jgi:hypothetical protein
MHMHARRHAHTHTRTHTHTHARARTSVDGFAAAQRLSRHHERLHGRVELGLCWFLRVAPWVVCVALWGSCVWSWVVRFVVGFMCVVVCRACRLLWVSLWGMRVVVGRVHGCVSRVWWFVRASGSSGSCSNDTSART